MEDKNVDKTAEAEAENTVNTEDTGNTAAEEMSAEEKLQAEVADLKDQNLRLFAEFENFRKRTAKEKIELMSSANKDTLSALLPVLDDFDRAVKNIEETAENKPVLEGMKLIGQKLTETLKTKGLVAMESSIGQAFDVESMEAITQIPAPSKDMAGKVVDEIEKGYNLGDKVLRYAKVVVAQEA